MEYVSWFSQKINLFDMIRKNVGVIGNGKWAKIMTPKIAKFANVKFMVESIEKKMVSIILPKES